MSLGLTQAIRSGRLAQVKYLVDGGLDINPKSPKTEPVLLSVLRVEDGPKRSKLFRFFIKRGANCCAVDSATGRDILSWACILQRDNEVKTLLSHALCDINLRHQDKNGLTALHFAVYNCSEGTVRILVEAMTRFCISVDIRDKFGVTPYTLATDLGFFRVANILVKEGNASTCTSGSSTENIGTNLNTQNVFFLTENPLSSGRESRQTVKYSDPKFSRSRSHSCIGLTRTPRTPRPKTNVWNSRTQGGQSNEEASSDLSTSEAESSETSGTISPVLPTTRPIKRELSSLMDIVSQQLAPGYREKANPRNPLQEHTMKNTALAMVFAAKLRRKVQKKALSPVSNSEKFNY